MICWTQLKWSTPSSAAAWAKGPPLARLERGRDRAGHWTYGHGVGDPGRRADDAGASGPLHPHRDLAEAGIVDGLVEAQILNRSETVDGIAGLDDRDRVADDEACRVLEVRRGVRRRDECKPRGVTPLLPLAS